MTEVVSGRRGVRKILGKKQAGVLLRKQFSNRSRERAAAISVLIFLFSSVSAIVYIYTNLKDKEWEKN